MGIRAFLAHMKSGEPCDGEQKITLCQELKGKNTHKTDWKKKASRIREASRISWMERCGTTALVVLGLPVPALEQLISEELTTSLRLLSPDNSDRRGG